MVYAFYFVVGIISSQKINLFGEVFLGEILCLVVLLVNAKSIRLPACSRSLLGLLLVWVIAQTLSDILNQTEFIKAIKGIFAPALVIIILLGLSTAFRKYSKYLPLYLFGVFMGMWLSRAIGSEYYAANPWKWGLGYCVALCFLTWIEFYCKRNRETYLLIGGLIHAVISIANSSRIMAGIVLLTCVLAILSNRIQNAQLYRHLCASRWGGVQFAVIVLLSVFIIDRSAAALFTYGPFLDLLPALDAMKFSRQAASDFGFIIGGRSEILVSFEAFLDAPLLGHGSWAENPYYTYTHLDRIDEAGSALHTLDVAEASLRSFRIPTHSYLMGAMVWGGFLAGFYWLGILSVLLFGFLNERVIASPFLLYITIGLIWSIMFSPFGADARWLSTVLLFVYFYLTRNLIPKKKM